MPKLQPEVVQNRLKDLSYSLTGALVEGNGMNDFLNRFLKAIASALQVRQLVLYDYNESENLFEFLYFRGYASDARAELSMRLHTIDLSRALKERDPFWLDDTRRSLLVPLYFQEVLEAVLLVESPAQELEIELDDCSLASCRLISRFLGLFMSSIRIDANAGMREDFSSKTDLQRAREVQLSYLPSDYHETDKYEIYGYNQSSVLVGGDYFDYFCQREQSIQCVVADACGHGMAAALIMSTFRGLLHSEVRRLQDFSPLFNILNQRLYLGGDLLQYLTGVFFDYDQELRQLRYLNAGHFDPLIVHSDKTSTRLTGGGPPLGMFGGSSYIPETAPIRREDILVLFTDGLIELRSAQDEFFGVERVLASIRAHRDLPLRDLAGEVLDTAARFSHKAQPDDDLTLFLMRFR
jgi:sigma-B regulation protein RsbU (phosphoserine phosphatase)